MSQKVNRLFQLISASSFLMQAYNTRQGIISRKELALINKQRQEEALEHTEEIKTLTSEMAKLSEKLFKDFGNRFIKEIDKAFDPCINTFNEANEDLIKALEQKEPLTVEELTDKFSDYQKLLLKGLERCRTGNAELKKVIENIGNSSGNNYNTEDISNFLSTLTFEQTVAVLHIFGFTVIIISLISLFTIFYGNILIDYFKLEQKLPRIAKFIQLRRKFQMYYSLLDFTIILIVISIMFYIDLLLFKL
jgi:hypothetical protein